jgi:hypothetical protein
MIKELKSYICEFDTVPTDDDLMQAIEIAKKDNCVVEIHWTLKWSGHYARYFYADDTLETARDKLPKIYGM